MPSAQHIIVAHGLESPSYSAMHQLWVRLSPTLLLTARAEGLGSLRQLLGPPAGSSSCAWDGVFPCLVAWTSVTSGGIPWDSVARLSHTCHADRLARRLRNSGTCWGLLAAGLARYRVSARLPHAPQSEAPLPYSCRV